MRIRNILTTIVIISTLTIVSCRKEINTSNKSEVLQILNKVNDQSINKKNKYKLLENLYIKLISNKNDSINRNFLFEISNVYYYDNELDNYLKIINKVKILSIADKDYSHLAKSLCYIGDYYDEKNLLDSAYYNYFQSEKFYIISKDSVNIGKVKLKKAGILYDNGSFKESENELVKALIMLKGKNELRLSYSCYNILGLNLIELKDYSKSLEYFNLAQNQLKEIEKKDTTNIKFSISNCYNNIGNVYLKIQNYENAQRFYNKALSIKDLNKSKPILYAMILSNLAYAKLKKGDASEAKKMFLESYKIRDSLKSDAGIISSKYYIGQYHLSQKDTLKAIENIASCYTLSKKIKSSPDVLNSLKLLTEIDTKNKNFYTNEYFRVSDSLQQAERATRNKFARIEFETDQVEEENHLLSRKNTYIIISSLIIIFIIGTLFFIYRLRTKNKELKHIQDQQSKNEEIYKLLLNQQSVSEESRKEERNRISKELHDGVVNSIFTTRFNLMQLDPSQIEQKNQLVKELEKTEIEIRRVSHELNENLNFNDNSIINMITNLVESQKNEWNTVFSLSIDKFINWNQIESETKINIYRIIQESLQNVNKYSKAQQCIVMILKTTDKTTIRIWDNGVGFNPEKVKKGIGLKNIQERVTTINGNLEIKSKNNQGTTVEIIF